ncbi:hypothetical protein A2U01_0060253, partial [Trifolium medium]|nr:hypothetical protein [Trifolium medium]
SLDELLAKAQSYIQYEEREVADAIRHSRPEDNHLLGSPLTKGETGRRMTGHESLGDHLANSRTTLLC